MDPTTTTDAAAVPAAAVAEVRAGSRGLLLIGGFEIFKAVFFVIAAAGVFHLVKRDTQVELIKLLHAFRISGDHAFIKDLLLRSNVITDPAKRILSGILLLYAALHATEGIGLVLRKRWAEYFTVIMTALPLPVEVYWLIHHTTHSAAAFHAPSVQQVPAVFSQHVIVLKIVVLLSNVAIVAYLLYHLVRSARRESGHALPAERRETAANP